MPDRRDLAEPRAGVTGAQPEVIRRLFDDVAPTYDLLNRLLSLGQDRRWRRAAVRMLRPKPGDLLVDLCAGTADLALAVQQAYPACRVICTDFSEPMLRLAVPKVARCGERRPRLAVADACRLPLPGECCAGVTVAFGLRNLHSLRAGLEEARRVLKPGGRLAILEFYRPTGTLASAKATGLQAFAPAVACLVAPKRASAYRYLARSIAEFLSVQEMKALLAETGFEEIESGLQLLGIAAVLGATRR